MIILIALISIVFGTSITSCQNINSDGTYYLANNLVNYYGDCIIVNAQNVVIDGQGYSITSLGSGIFINVSSFNIYIVNVRINSLLLFDSSNINLQGSVENSTIKIYNSTLRSNEINLWVINENSVNNLSIEIVNSTLNASNYHNIYFFTNKSSNNTIRIVNSSMYSKEPNIAPNNNPDGFVENLVIEIVNSTLNAPNHHNIYFLVNKSSNNTIRIVNSSMYSKEINIVPNNNPNGSVENLVIEIVNSTFVSNNHSIFFYTNKSSNNTIRIVNSPMYSKNVNIVPNNNPNGSVENLVIEILNSTLNSSDYYNIYFDINKSSNNTIRIVNSPMYSKNVNIVPNNNPNGSVENLVIEIVNSTFVSNNHSIFFYTNKSSNNTIRIVNSSMYSKNVNIVPNNYPNGSVENLVIEIVNSTLNSSDYYNIYFDINKSSNNTIRIVNSPMYANRSNIVFLSYSANLNNIIQINDSILESNYTNIYFNDSNSSTNRNNTVIILRSNLSADTNFLLYSLNKTLNDYNMLIVNTSLIGNVSFNLTEVTLNISGFNNLFLSNQHFVNSSSNISGILNISKTLGTSIIGTPYLGGNYWKGYSDLCLDFDGDGLCESPYVISSNAIDYLPLTNHTHFVSKINNYISIGLSEMIKLSSPFPYLLLGSIILLLFRIIKLKIIALQDRVILQFNNILNMPIKNLKINIDGQELVTDENGQIILSSMPKQIKPNLYILIKL
jgi:hypothetical protein